MNAKAFVVAMRGQGGSVTYKRYLLLERGEYPNEREAFQIPHFLGDRDLFARWMFNHDVGFVVHADTFAGAPPRVQKLLMEMVAAGVRTAEELGIR